MATGSKSDPLATFKKAIEMAGPEKRIYACAEEFNEAAEIPSGFTVFGGLGCALKWEYIGAQVKTSIKAAPGEVPLGRSVLYEDVLAFDITEVTEPLAEGV